MIRHRAPVIETQPGPLLAAKTLPLATCVRNDTYVRLIFRHGFIRGVGNSRKALSLTRLVEWVVQVPNILNHAHQLDEQAAKPSRSRRCGVYPIANKCLGSHRPTPTGERRARVKRPSQSISGVTGTLLGFCSCGYTDCTSPPSLTLPPNSLKTWSRFSAVA